MSINKRLMWVDFAKGLGIIGVVVGHSDTEFLKQYIFWFHMPLFFIISGFLFKPVNSVEMFWAMALKRTKQLLIPYISFFIFIYMIKLTYHLIINEFSMNQLLLDWIKFFYGGQVLTGFYATFWFITCLLIVQLIFSLILLKFKSNKVQVILIFFAYILAHLESWFSQNVLNIMIPWNADVALLALSYFAIGYYGRINLENLNHKVILNTAVIFTLGFVAFMKNTSFDYSLDLKYLIYPNILLDLLVPISLSIIILYISYFFSCFNIFSFLTYIGASSLTIMYLHFPIKYLILETGYYNTIVFMILGVAIPFILFQYLFKKSTVGKFLFLGAFINENRK